MSHPTPLLRTATISDAPRLATLGLQVWLHTYCTQGINNSIAHYVLNEFTAAKFTALIADSTRSILVLEQGDNLVAYLTLHHGQVFADGFADDFADVCNEIETLYVQAPFLRQGLGQRLLAQARELLVQAGENPAVWLKVNAQNLAAQAFYQAQGFVIEGETDFVLDGVAYQNWVMVKR